MNPMLNDLPVINSHDSWSPLEEVWLGDVYPSAWYDHLDIEVREIFYRLTDITQQDLSEIENRLISFGIKVRRPGYDRIDDFIDHTDHLLKPQICPRDHFVVIGNRLIGQRNQITAWQKIIDDYVSQNDGSQFLINDQLCINGANVVRVGRDIIVDRDVFDYEYRGEWPQHRVQVLNNGGHMDGCFAILRPGLILANHYYDDYDRTFPGWEIIRLDHPRYQAAPLTGYKQRYPVYNGKFWDTTIGTNRAFNQHIIRHALDWVGCYIETFFELNCLVLDESNVMMLAENLVLAEDLARRGINVHWVPFRTRSFWDGAVHCLTLDIRRRSQIKDYFSSRDAH